MWCAVHREGPVWAAGRGQLHWLLHSKHHGAWSGHLEGHPVDVSAFVLPIMI